MIHCILPVDKNSRAYRRMYEAGFRIKGVYSRKEVFGCTPVTDVLICYIDFECVCGRKESFVQSFSDIGAPYFETEFKYRWPMNGVGEVDAAFILEREGAFSEDHLREDGFNESEIEHIRRPYGDYRGTREAA